MPDEYDLSGELRQAIAREASAKERSESEQITHWLTIGRAVESMASFDFGRVEAAFSQQLAITELTEAEHAVWSVLLIEDLIRPSAEEDAFFAKRRAKGVGVGLDDLGRLVDAPGKPINMPSQVAVPPIHPGLRLELEVLRPRQLDAADLACLCDIPIGTSKALLEGEAPFETNLAKRVETQFGLAFGTLIRMQAAFDENERDITAGSDGDPAL